MSKINKYALIQHLLTTTREKTKIEPITLEETAKIIKERVIERNYDAVIAVTGYEGIGKSTLAIQLALTSNPKFNFETQIIYTPTIEELKEKYKKEERGTVFIADEAIKILYKLNWQTKLQKFINELYTTSRDENKITLLCMPRFLDFNEYFRNHRIILHIHVFARGYAVIFGKTKNPFSQDPWAIKYNESLIDLLENRLKPKVVEDWINIFSKCKGFIGFLTFDDLSDEIKAKYLEIKNKHKFDDVNVEEQLNRVEKIRLKAYAKAFEKLLQLTNYTYKQLANELGVSEHFIYEMLKYKDLDVEPITRNRVKIKPN